MTVLVDPQSATEKELRERVSAVCSAFEEQKGTLSFTSRRDPLANLVETVLSHNTNDRNRDIAFRALRLKYPTWEEVHHAAREELELVIRPAGLNRQKAERIQRLLEYLKTKYGDYTVDFLDTMSFDDAFLELGHLKGIGYKTLAVVMSFHWVSMFSPLIPMCTVYAGELVLSPELRCGKDVPCDAVSSPCREKLPVPSPPDRSWKGNMPCPQSEVR